MIDSASGSRREAAGLVIRVLCETGSPGMKAAACEVASRLRSSPRVASVNLDPLPFRPFPRDRPAIPFQDLMEDDEADAAVMVASRRWGTRRLAPGPTIRGTPFAIVQADHPDDLPPVLPTPDAGAPWILAAMAKNVFLEPSSRWAGVLARAGRGALDLRADRARRGDLIDAMRSGPGVVLYAGHGRPRGWGGYQALRWEHFLPDAGDGWRSAGLVVALACDTLKRMRSQVPFGTRLVAGGVAGAYLGAAGPLRTDDARELGDTLVELLASYSYATIAHLVSAIDDSVGQRTPAARAWRSFRLLGNPALPITA